MVKIVKLFQDDNNFCYISTYIPDGNIYSYILKNYQFVLISIMIFRLTWKKKSESLNLF